MAKRLEGKTIVVTGASSGIGKSTGSWHHCHCSAVAHRSNSVKPWNLTARRVDNLKKLAEQIKNEVGEGVQVLPIKLDVSKPDEVRGFVDSLPKEFKDIDVLVNNA